jgi:hypothetical protein
VERTAIAYLLLGLVVIATRGPLLLWPKATLRSYRWLLTSQMRLRVFGVVLCLPAASLIRLEPAPSGAAQEGLLILGWLLAAVAVWLIVAPRGYQLLGEAVFELLEDSGVARAFGVLGASIGMFFVWVGVSLLEGWEPARQN